jgi:nucleotide-binding universal stress UspA family protein
MSYTSILVEAEPGDHARARLRCAVDLADRFEALLIGLAAEEMALGPSGEPIDACQADWLIAMRDQLEADLRDAEQGFRAEAGTRRHLWKTRRIRPADALAEAARAADLIVAGGSTQRDRGPDLSADLAQLLLTCGRPVLVAPPTGERVLAERVVVGWSDRRESRRALLDAVPFLQRAKDVLVVEVAPKARLARAEESVAEVANALSYHGVPARAEVVEGHGSSQVVEHLKERGRWLGADLIVGGAYGHSRVGEVIMGGVTREFLSHPQEFFVLLSH